MNLQHLRSSLLIGPVFFVVVAALALWRDDVTSRLLILAALGAVAVSVGVFIKERQRTGSGPP